MFKQMNVRRVQQAPDIPQGMIAAEFQLQKLYATD